MPGPRILPLRQARKTAIALQTLPLRQAFYYLVLTPVLTPGIWRDARSSYSPIAIGQEHRSSIGEPEK